MKKSEILLANAIIWLISIHNNDCNLAVIVTLLSLPALLEKKRGKQC